MGVSQNKGYHFGGPNNKDYSILGSILGFPYFGETTTCPRKKKASHEDCKCQPGVETWSIRKSDSKGCVRILVVLQDSRESLYEPCAGYSAWGFKAPAALATYGDITFDP